MKEVKQEIYTKKWNNPEHNNVCGIIFYKSMRKNSKCIDYVDFIHLIPSAGPDKIPDARIIDYYLNILEKAIYIVKKTPQKKFIAKTWIDVNKLSTFVNANGDNFNDIERISLDFPKKEFCSINQFASHLYDMFALVYPYNTISLKTLYSNQRFNKLIYHDYKN